MIGILSERDIVRAVAKRGTTVFDDAVSMHMTAKVVSTSEDERVHAAKEKMTNGRFRHLRVICHERIVGLVSIGDMVKHQLAECQHEHKAMREYIARLSYPQKIGRRGALMQFTVGFKLKGKTDHIAVDAEDALIAALKVKTEHPEAVITYVRQQNRRGDARHPPHALVENAH